MAVVYQSEPSRFASTVLGAETEAGHLVFVGFVELGEFLAEFVFGDVGAIGMEDVTVVERDQNTAHDRLEGDQSKRGYRCKVGSTHTTICFRPRRELRMNLRVRSVTGCSLSAMFASCMVPLAKTLGIVDVNASTNRVCVAGCSVVKQSRVGPSAICVCEE